jgi:hypothetical protein
LIKDQAYRREDEIHLETQTEIKKVVRDEESKLIEVRRENAQLKLRVQTLSSDLVGTLFNP